MLLKKILPDHHRVGLAARVGVTSGAKNAQMEGKKRTNRPKTAQSPRQAAFARNVRWACDRMDFGSLREAAEAIGVSYVWLRRAVTQGVAWTRKDNPSVDKLAGFFEVHSYVLWEDSDEHFRKAVIAKANPDYITHCLMLEGVLRHYRQARPNLLAKCLALIDAYARHVADPGEYGDPYNRFLVVENLDVGRRFDHDTTSWIDYAVDRRLNELRMLPRAQILEEAVAARVRLLQLRTSLVVVTSDHEWKYFLKKALVAMMIGLMTDVLQQEGELSAKDERKAKLLHLAEEYARRLWDGEFGPYRKIVDPFGRTTKGGTEDS